MLGHIPLGYLIRNGKVIVDEGGKKVVNGIFISYDSGKSATSIAKELVDRKTLNAMGRVAWTHGTVGRILENTCYLGTQDYPRIVENELFQRVQNKRDSIRKHKKAGEYDGEKIHRLLFKDVLICEKCGSPYSRIKKVKKGIAKITWKCKSYAYEGNKSCIGGYISDEQIKAVCVDAINQIIQDKRKMRPPSRNKRYSSKCYRELEQQLNETKENPPQTEANKLVTQLLREMASERYKLLEIQDGYYKTDEMHETLRGMTELTEFDEQLYRKLIKTLAVSKAGTVKVTFINESSLVISYKFM